MDNQPISPEAAPGAMSPTPTVPPPLPPPPIAPLPRGAAGAPKFSGGRSGTGWKVATLILLVLLIFSAMVHFSSLLSGLGALGGSGFESGPNLQEVVMERHAGHDKIAVLDVQGLIMEGGLGGGGPSLVRLIDKQLDLAAGDARVKAVVLRIDSPGGEVLASDEIYKRIADFQQRSGKPVVASMGSVAASGGYYVAAPCQWIVSNELTLTGSIGVIMHGYNYRGLMDKIGLRPEVYKSGKYKDMMSGDRPWEDITPDERKMMQKLIDEVFGRFKSVVRDGRQQAVSRNAKSSERGRPLVADWEDYADGRILSGGEAHRLGFVDELGNFETAVKAAKRLGSVKDATLVQYLEPFDLSHLFRILGKSEPPTIKVNLGPETLRLQSGRLYFIAPSFLR